ncbi:MAG TPA: carbamoyltransferase HypF [Candidatus Acidoferrales bacterium]|nr:carbamoyltransferase HypF [Candidatus Acidoferrales bacterium]
MNQRAHIAVRGAVQGVGFRPFIYRLANEIGLVGWVLNSPQGVFIEVEGEKSRLDEFVLRIEKNRPPRASIQSLECRFVDPVGYRDFTIRESDAGGARTTLVLPDIAACPDCVREIFDPSDRRYRYPFTNCTHCGPRFTIVESLPYDRANTSMRKFDMCADCRREYQDPRDRRFHAQPNACPKCGPQLRLWDEQGRVVATGDRALCEAVDSIRSGRIVAIKGLGGFHLVTDARNDRAVSRLRERKRREEKPFALMAPSLEAVKTVCEVSALEERLLLGPEAPIVLLRRHPGCVNSAVSPAVAPRNPYLGIMLPYTPLHHLLMRALGFFIVATSANLSDEPICTDEREAVERLHGIADVFLVHNRPIVRHADDSVARIMGGRELLLRRARGYAPLPVCLKQDAPALLAVGGQLKNSVAITVGPQVFISQHIGDLETTEAFTAFRDTIESLQRLYGVTPQRNLCDLHPDYLSTRYARERAVSAEAIQHHWAHIASCMAENELEGDILGVAWDGTGYGPDGTVWGGEFLLTDGASFRRFASLRRFRLPGGERAIREPRRAALGVLYEIFGDQLFDGSEFTLLDQFDSAERAVLRQMVKKAVNSPYTSSAGRLFDAVSSLLGLCQRSRFEGQAAMELEFAADQIATEERYPFSFFAGKGEGKYDPAWVVDWEPLIRAVLKDAAADVPRGIIAAKFHNTLVEVIAATATRAGERRIALSGGCFQNRYLLERVIGRLQAAGLHPYWHQRVPPNDGGIALGQVYAWLHAHRREDMEETSEEKAGRGTQQAEEIKDFVCA